MPLYKEWNPGLHSLAAIWHITEPESFFLEKVQPASAIRNDKRRIEHLAGRYLLQHLRADFPLHDIVPDDQDKPVLPDASAHFSVSHSFPYAAAMIHSYHPVGIDLQCWHERILKIRNKFLSEAEQDYCRNDEQLTVLAWSAKEAAYKYHGRRGTDFIAHLPLVKWEQRGGISNITINIKQSGQAYDLTLKGFIFNDFALCLTEDKFD
jgi:4'-phosphopantetheinyl transferase EntD